MAEWQKNPEKNNGNQTASILGKCGENHGKNGWESGGGEEQLWPMKADRKVHSEEIHRVICLMNVHEWARLARHNKEQDRT